ncbi:MAG TPA: signal peptidase II [Acidimicrobiia bacterium]|nr:signal peptidase II [Acidimicrobiia bacterium]
MRGTHLLIRRYLIGLGIATAIVVADLLTKRYAALNFDGNPVEIIPGFFGFTFVENPGGAFGMFQNGGVIIGIAAVIITLVVLVALASERPMAETVALGLVIGGAVGNLVDRFARGDGIIDGAVIDWVELWWIPTFNIADSSVTVAVALLLIHAWRSK